MTKKVNDVCKAYGKDIEEATEKLKKKFNGFCVLHPEFSNAELEYDAGDFTKADGTQGSWAKLFQYVEEGEPIANHPEVAKKSNKRKSKAKVA